MNVLAFDTALSGCSAAMLDTQTGVCVSEGLPMERGQAEALVPMVLRVLDRAGAAFSDIDLIATTVGPGAFTGLRIGLAAAEGFALALDRAVAGVTTLEAVAAGFFAANSLEQGQTLCVLIETKRKDFYVQMFGPEPLTEPMALGGEDIAKITGGGDVVYIGDAARRFAGDFSVNVTEGFDLPDPRVVASLAADRYRGGAVRGLAPLYLRGADVSQSQKKQRIILA